MSLLSLPQELIDMIFAEGLQVSDFGKVRLLSKDHNARFGGHFWDRTQVFKTIRVKLLPGNINKLIAAIEGSEVLPYLQHATISAGQVWYSRSRRDEKLDPEVVPLLAKAFSILTSLKTIDVEVNNGTNAIGFWKPTIDAIIAAGTKNIETINGPIAAIQMSKFKPLATAKLLRDYKTTFCNLKTLKIQTSVQIENPTATTHFWSIIAAMGTKLEDLTVKNSRVCFKDDPTPSKSSSYQCEGFSLPELKRLKLVDVAITSGDLKALLGNSDGIESISIAECRMPNEKDDWFEVLRYLRSERFPQLNSLYLAMSACYDEVSYELPKFSVEGDWMTEDCSVTLPSGKRANYVWKKNLWSELGKHKTVDKFWNSVTDKKWKSKQATRWKRRRLINDGWKLEMRRFGDPDYIDDDDPWVREVNDRYQGKLDLIDAEVDD
ncbi:hypothetical protein TWF192_000196 [Orbilia oligospora]|uniref:Uncharacterized protein n=1 Tax=Orbilia oligospora TaxID=2813651 RepID=A0A6G1MQD2_ORBOL|nr:hypothetical protein TWF679_008930 [Orbilia oligospora]KAF3265546.1 hypothetical protein TWF192_000196 [Orbilia oligospora]